MPQMKRIQPSGAQNHRKKRLKKAEDNVMRGSLDVWVKKQYVAKDQSNAENREPVTIVQDGVSNLVNTELDIGGDNQDENSSQKSIPDGAYNFAEVSANVKASTVTLNDDAEGNNNDEDFFELFRNHDFRRLRKPISIHLVKCLVHQVPENFQHKEGPFAKKEGNLFISTDLKLFHVMGAFAEKMADIFTMQTSSLLLCLLFIFKM